MNEKPIEDEDDVLVQNFSFVLLLSLGILSLSASAILFLTTAIQVLYGGQLPADLLSRSIFSALFFVTGLSSLYVFRNKRESRKRKQSGFFSKSKT